MGHHDHRHSLLGKFDHYIQHFFDHLRVECRGRLIEEHDLGLHTKAACYGDSLLLSAGELTWILSGLLRDMHPVEIGHRKVGGVALGKAPGFHRRQGQVINNAEMREQVELLKYHPDIFSDLGDVFYILGELIPADPDLAFIVFLEPINAADHGGLSRP